MRIRTPYVRLVMIEHVTVSLGPMTTGL
jgi:hypothetical protein